MVTEAREAFARDSTEHHKLPRVGVQIRRDGWRPFVDPRVVDVIFEQGLVHESGDVHYTNLGSLACSFVDKHGRLFADDVRCPMTSGYLQGSFADEQFAFVRAVVSRCSNGTDEEGQPLPGMCRPPDEIDRVMADSLLYLFEANSDMRADINELTLQTREWRREMRRAVHLAADMVFTERSIQIDPRFSFVPMEEHRVTVFEEYRETFTSFSNSSGQYCAVYFQRGTSRIRQHRKRRSLYGLLESIGGFVFALLAVFGGMARQWNGYRFRAQLSRRILSGDPQVDVRTLERSQFSRFGQLQPLSFLLPRELQSLTAETTAS